MLPTLGAGDFFFTLFLRTDLWSQCRKMWLDRLQKSNCLYGILVRARDLKRNPGGGGVLSYISNIRTINSRLADTPIIRTNEDSNLRSL